MYLEYIRNRVCMLLEGKKPLIQEHIFLPLNVQTEFSYPELAHQISHLQKEYKDIDAQSSYANWNMMYHLMERRSLYDNWLFQGHLASAETDSYYRATLDLADELKAVKGTRQNRLYEIVLRNLLIISENILRSNFVVNLNTIDITFDAVKYLCSYELNNLLKIDEGYEYNGNLDDNDQLFECIKYYKGFPFHVTEWVDDPECKNKIVKFFSHPQIQQNKEIKPYDCNFAFYFYSVLLTALATRLEDGR